MSHQLMEIEELIGKCLQVKFCILKIRALTESREARRARPNSKLGLSEKEINAEVGSVYIAATQILGEMKSNVGISIIAGNRPSLLTALNSGREIKIPISELTGPKIRQVIVDMNILEGYSQLVSYLAHHLEEDFENYLEEKG